MVKRQVDKVFRVISCSSNRVRQRRLKAVAVRTWREASLHARAPESLRQINSSLHTSSNHRDDEEAVNKTETGIASPSATKSTLASAWQEPEVLKSHLKKSESKIDTKRALWFLSCKVALPAERRRRLASPEVHEATLSAAQSAAENIGDRELHILRLFQARIKTGYQRRAELRLVEFSAWLLEGNPRQGPGRQRILSAITFAFVAVLSAFTLGICLLLSLAFTTQECLLWVVGVGKSLLMQLFVTEPLVGLVVLSLKFTASWGLVTANRVHRRKLQQRDWMMRDQWLALREQRAREELHALLNEEQEAAAASAPAAALGLNDHQHIDANSKQHQQQQRHSIDLRRSRSSSLQHRLNLIELERAILAAEKEALVDGGESRSSTSPDGGAVQRNAFVKQTAIMPLRSVATTTPPVETAHTRRNDVRESQKCNQQPGTRMQLTDLDDNSSVVFEKGAGLDPTVIFDGGAGAGGADGRAATAQNQEAKFMPERASEAARPLKRMPSLKMLFGPSGLRRRLMRRARNVKLITPTFYNSLRAPTHGKGSRPSAAVHKSSTKWSAQSNNRGRGRRQTQNTNATSAESSNNLANSSSAQLSGDSDDTTTPHHHVGVSERTFVDM